MKVDTFAKRIYFFFIFVTIGAFFMLFGDAIRIITELLVFSISLYVVGGLCIIASVFVPITAWMEKRRCFG